jgi:dienelactone hydrolase
LGYREDRDVRIKIRRRQAIVHDRDEAMITSQTFDYREGDTVLEGTLFHDDAISGKRPGIMVVPEWYGINDFTFGRCKALAEMGFAAMAVDVYGKGIRPAAFADAQRESQRYYDDRLLLRRRGLAGLNALRAQAVVDPAMVLGIGYCFGGITLLEIARAGAAINGIVCFHTQLMTSMPAAKGDIKGKILVLHGAYDPIVPQQEIDDFIVEMRAAQADWQMISYGNAVHSYTNPSWPIDPTHTKNTAYEPTTDRRSWDHMKLFFVDVLDPPVGA